MDFLTKNTKFILDIIYHDHYDDKIIFLSENKDFDFKIHTKSINDPTYIKLRDDLWLSFLENIFHQNKEITYKINHYFLEEKILEVFCLSSTKIKDLIFNLTIKLLAILENNNDLDCIINTDLSCEEKIIIKKIFKLGISSLPAFYNKKNSIQNFVDFMIYMNKIIVNSNDFILWTHNIEQNSSISTRVKIIKITIIIIKYFIDIDKETY
jgi:hypothetical protein